MVDIDRLVAIELKLAVDLRAAERFRLLLRHPDENDLIPHAPLPAEVVGDIVFSLFVLKLINRNLIPFRLRLHRFAKLLRHLQWMEVDIEQQRLKKIVKKSDKPLSLPLNDAAFAIVQARQAIQNGAHVFYNPMTGGKFKDVKGALLAAVKRAGLPKITWHMFRHSFASRLTRDGVDVVTVKDLLGHSDISTTMRYAHSNDEAK